MPEKKITKKKKTSEVSLFYETMEEIFSLCLQKAGLTRNDFKWYEVLYEKIAKEFPDSPLDASYVKNIKSRLQSKKYPMYIMERQFIEPIAFFVGIADYIEFNERYDKMESKVIYTGSRFNYFNFLRVSELGNLTKTKDEWNFKGMGFSIGANHIKTITLFRMAGDREDCWIKISYEFYGVTKDAYFAELRGSVVQQQNHHSKIFRLLHLFLKKEKTV